MRFMHVDEAVELMKLEYAETPDLAVTVQEARQLWNFSEELCERALHVLVSSSYLVRQENGCFIRSTTNPISTTTHSD